MYLDRPLTKVQAIAGQSEQLDSDTVLIFPNGVAWANVDIPQELRHYALIPRTQSRWARVGMQVQSTSGIIARPYDTTTALLSNWAPSYALVVQTGDTVALTIDRWIEQLPLVDTIPLTAGATLLRMKEAMLPKRKSVPVFDPRETDIRECMETISYDALELKKRAFLVVSACERPFIPLKRHIGFITSAVGRLLQNSAQYDHAGSHGTRVMEFKALRSTRIEPGMHIGNLSIYQTPSPLPSYEGILGKNESIMPPPFPWM